MRLNYPIIRQELILSIVESFPRNRSKIREAFNFLLTEWQREVLLANASIPTSVPTIVGEFSRREVSS